MVPSTHQARSYRPPQNPSGNGAEVVGRMIPAMMELCVRAVVPIYKSLALSDLFLFLFVFFYFFLENRKRLRGGEEDQKLFVVAF